MLSMVLVAGLVGPPAPPQPEPYKPRQEPTTSLGCTLLVTAAAMDVASTEYKLSQGYLEANPAMRNRAVRISSKLAASAGLCWIDKHLRSRGHDKAAWWITGGVTALWAGVAVRNMTR